MFWQRYCDGVSPVKIFQDAELSIDIIGKGRVDGFLKQLRELKERGLPFNDGSERQFNQPPKQYHFPTPPRRPKNAQISLSPQAIAKMAHEVAYLKQELEFIKKIILAGTEVKS